MDTLLNLVQGFLNIGAVSMLPIFITVMGLVFGMGFFKSLKNGLLVGIGFQGISLVITFMMQAIDPVIAYFGSAGSSMSFSIVDVGWASLAGAAWGSPFAAVVLPAGFVLNFIMIKLKLTKTLNVDVWNYWHFIFTATIVYYIMLGGSFSVAAASGVGFLAALAVSYLACVIGDKIAGGWQQCHLVTGKSIKLSRPFFTKRNGRLFCFLLNLHNMPHNSISSYDS